MTHWARSILTTTGNWLRSPVTELNRSQRFVRYAIELTRHVNRELRRDRAVQLSAALAFRTVFSLVPLMVVMLLMFKAFGGFDDASNSLRDNIYKYLDLDGEVEVVAVVEDSAESIEASEADPTSDAESEEVIGPGSSDEGINDGAQEDAEAADLEAPESPTTKPATASAMFRWAHIPVEPDNELLPALETVPDDRADQLASIRVRLDELFDGLTTRMRDVNFRSIGMFGILLLIWSAIRLIVTTEQAFNQVVKAQEDRSWPRRVMIYWAVITLGPVLLALSLQTVEILLNATADLPVVGEVLLDIGGRVVSVSATWLLLFLIYRTLPTRQLGYRPLLIGGLVAALFWEAWKYAFRLYIGATFTGDSSTSTLYGSLALVPVFLLWVQVTWLIILFGLSLAYTLHAMPSRRLQDTGTAAQRKGLLDPRWVLPILSAIADRFDRGRTTQVERLAARVSLPPQPVSLLLNELASAGLVHHVRSLREDQDDPGFALARPAHRIKAKDVLDLIHKIADNPNTSPNMPGLGWLRQLQAAEHAAIDNLSLADLLARADREGDYDRDEDESAVAPDAVPPSGEAAAVSAADKTRDALRGVGAVVAASVASVVGDAAGDSVRQPLEGESLLPSGETEVDTEPNA